MNPKARIKVVLIDDHALVRDGIRALLMAVPELDVVGEAGCGAEAIDLLERVSADVVLMDIGLKDVNGLELTQSLRERFPGIRVLILSMYDNQEYVTTSVKVGAHGYVLKDAPSREIIVAIEAIAAGNTYYSEGIAEKLASRGGEERELTPREREVLLMLAQGHNNKTMARALQISVRTVETHRLSIRRKLDIDRPADLMKHAMVHGWLPGQH
ncbi:MULTISPECIES: response regulator [Pseudomonadaceae]|uniref:response regulator n=1 Tax=Pseudomonadaceae TaxID=135621 RepID=UPI00103B129D|nr:MULTISPECIES: response regulator transcription factor [Pseudomonadaceae]MBA1279994.1 response regulator transcription factor [Stutzerimonas stutzeri]MBC8651554.1 response regulator transcription factor [Pseudomonas sp. MT4]QXY91948.1 response regulator transcription factor [Pseudomonas sp. MTM4]TCD18387.1 response regulator transcription factor [Pseudomonas sp. IC_126]